MFIPAISAALHMGLMTALPVSIIQSIPKVPHHLTAQGEQFMLDGKPFIIRSGEMHYPRVARPYWRDRMRKMRAMGLNTLCTYVFWNLHESKRGKFDFKGNLDLAAFIKTAQEEGLYVIVRPGPYICTEWEWGGFPAWLFQIPGIKVRSADPKFLDAAARYVKQVGHQIAPLLGKNGGPIILAQVENEYGSFGSDKVYMNAVRKMMQDAGIDTTYYTSDGPGQNMLNGGTLPDVLSVINFGQGNPEPEFREFAKFRTNVPKMCGEYWCGWFDHWGEEHHRTGAKEAADGVEWMLSRGISFNLYMAHGGSSFGFMSGANYGGAYEPDISAYDYDSPLDEAGRVTPKFSAIRNVIKKYLPAGETIPEAPSSPSLLSIPNITFSESASISQLLGTPQKSEMPKSVEELKQDLGLTLYRTQNAAAKSGVLKVDDARDYATIMSNGIPQGTLDRRKKEKTVNVNLPANSTLDILVENMGRVNFGPRLVDDHKGIIGNVSFGGTVLKGWDQYTLPLNDLSALAFSNSIQSGPAFYRAHFELKKVGDTFIDTRNLGKGFVWVNGHNLGRFWRIGPQQTLFTPAMWLKKGENEIVVFDYDFALGKTIQGVMDPIYETPGAKKR